MDVKRALFPITALLAFAGLCVAQAPEAGRTAEASLPASVVQAAPVQPKVPPAPALTPPEQPVLTFADPGAIDFSEVFDSPGSTFYGSIDYLLWWIKKGPVDAPLVTANANPATIAALNEPGTVILFGPGSRNSLSYKAFSGVRGTLGGWLDSDNAMGIEGSGFLLQRRPVTFSAFTPGTPVLAHPIFLPVAFGANPPGENSFNNGGAPETISVQSSSQLWGAEANGLYELLSTQRIQFRLLAGFRYLDLMENLRLSDLSADAATGGVLLAQDRFQTRNQFYGGQIGTRLALNFGRLSAEATLLAALGSSQEILSIRGATTVTNGAFGNPSGTFLGGVYAEPSNIGTFHRSAFAVVPEARLQVSYDLTSWLRARVGYNFLYFSDVLRPGNQVDRVVNANQNGLFGTGTVLNPARPTPLLQRSDFWAQGVSLGLEFRY